MKKKTKDQSKTVAFYQTHFGEMHFLMRELITLDCKSFVMEQKRDAAKIIPKEGATKDWLTSRLCWSEEDDREAEYLHLLQERYKERIDVIKSEIESFDI